MDDFKALQSALEACGVAVNDFALADFDGYGRGLASQTARLCGQELFVLPLRCCLTDRKEDAPERLQEAYSWLEALASGGDAERPEGFEKAEAEDLRLCLRIWCERTDPSSDVFRAWMPLLETGVNLASFAHRWSEEAVAACGPLSSIPVRLAAVRDEFNVSKRQFCAVFARFAEKLGSAPDEAQLEWLHFLCRSRAYPFRPEAGEAFNAICPVADLANHEPQNASTLKFAAPGSSNAIVIQAVRDVEAGGQLLYEYQKSSNDELACNFGFVLPTNSHQQVPLSISFGKVTEERIEALASLNLAGFLRMNEDGKSSVQIVLRELDPFPNAILVLMRILTFKGKIGNTQGLLKQVSNETKEMDSSWMPTILGALKSQLQLYPPRSGGAAGSPQDIVYNTTRAVIKKAVERLLALMTQLDAVAAPARAQVVLPDE